MQGLLLCSTFVLANFSFIVLFWKVSPFTSITKKRYTNKINEGKASEKRLTTPSPNTEQGLFWKVTLGSFSSTRDRNSFRRELLILGRIA